MQPGFKLPSRDKRRTKRRRKSLTTDDSVLTIQQAADALGVHYQTIRNWMKAGELPYTKRGHTVRIAREVINGTEQGRGNTLPTA